MHTKCISLKELYNVNGNQLHYGGYIDFHGEGGDKYYDLRTAPPESSRSELSCCDGEECVIISNDGHSILLSNVLTGKQFRFTVEEYDIAVFDSNGE